MLSDDLYIGIETFKATLTGCLVGCPNHRVDEDRHCRRYEVIPFSAAGCRLKRVFHRQNQVNAKAHIQNQRCKLKSLKEQAIRGAHYIERTLETLALSSAPLGSHRSGPGKNLLQSEVAGEKDRSHNLDQSVPRHACFDHADVGDEHLRMRLQILIIVNGQGNSQQTSDR